MRPAPGVSDIGQGGHILNTGSPSLRAVLFHHFYSTSGYHVDFPPPRGACAVFQSSPQTVSQSHTPSIPTVCDICLRMLRRLQPPKGKRYPPHMSGPGIGVIVWKLNVNQQSLYTIVTPFPVLEMVCSSHCRSKGVEGGPTEVIPYKVHETTRHTLGSTKRKAGESAARRL